MNARFDLLWVDQRLHEWSRYFKDRAKYSACKSIESRFQASSDDFAVEGWGEPSTPRFAPPVDVRSALETHSAVSDLPKSQKWAVTFWYCYPDLERWRVLKAMRKYTGRRFTWKDFTGEIEIGRVRVAGYLVSTSC